MLIKHRCFVALPLNPELQPITVESRGKVENVRFSLNHRFAAVQRSDVELEFMDLLQGTSFSHTCKGAGSKGRWRILAFHWTGTPVADFVVVTTAGASESSSIIWMRSAGYIGSSGTYAAPHLCTASRLTTRSTPRAMKTPTRLRGRTPLRARITASADARASSCA